MTGAPPFDPSDAAWLAHRYDAPGERIMFRHVPRERHAAGPFLTDALVGERPQAILSREEAVVAARSNAAPLHFLFHSAFCASTLLVRALDRPGSAMGLSEPVLLNDIVGLHRRGERKGAQLAHLLDDALGLLARRWKPGEAVVIKPSNVTAGLMPAMLALRPASHALFLYAPLPEFLLSVARKGLECRLWARELLEGLIRENLVDFGFSGSDYFRLSDLQVAAVGWLAQQRLFARLAAQYPDRVRTLRSEELLADAPAMMGALTSFWQLGSGDESTTEAGPGVFGRHSKTGSDYSLAARAREREADAAAHRHEIDMVHAWAVILADRAEIPMTLPLPLSA